MDQGNEENKKLESAELTAEIEQKLFEEYQNTKSPEVREKIILHYSGLVKYCVGRLNIHLGGMFEFEDLVSYGIFGLIDAIDKYELSKGVKFETYAMLRIRGAVIDNVRKLDWVPRSLRNKQKMLDRAYSKLESEGAEISDFTVARALDLSENEVRDLYVKSQLHSLVSLDEYLLNNSEPVHGVEDGSGGSPEKIIEQSELKKMLADAISGLSEKEQLVLSLYYYEGLTQKEVAEVVGVTDSRVSQIHTKALYKLSRVLGKYKSILLDI